MKANILSSFLKFILGSMFASICAFTSLRAAETFISISPRTANLLPAVEPGR